VKDLEIAQLASELAAANRLLEDPSNASARAQLKEARQAIEAVRG
jgi:hypothetical protein